MLRSDGLTARMVGAFLTAAILIALCSCFALSDILPQGDVQAQVIELVNEERAKKGLNALAHNDILVPVANLRAEEATRSWSHTRPDGSKWSTAFKELQIPGSYRGENLAKGYKTPKDAVKAWMKSKKHRKNIMNERFNFTAIGIFDRRGFLFWSQMFAEDFGGNGLPTGTPPIPEAQVLPVTDDMDEDLSDEDLPEEALPEGAYYALVDGVNLNLRESASTRGEVVDVMRSGLKVVVFEVKGGWAFVETPDGTQGWASAKYLSGDM